MYADENVAVLRHSIKDICFNPIANTVVYYFSSEIGTTSLQGTKLLPPECPLFGGSTVFIFSTLYVLMLDLQT